MRHGETVRDQRGFGGVFGKDFTLELVHDLTLAIARHFARGPILVGYDGRDTSRIVAKAVCSALNYSGLDCGDAGLVPTPCLEYCVPKLGYAGGMMITASHNPPEYNGIKPVAPDGVEISREEEDIIEGYYRNKESISAERWGSTAPEPRAVETYVAGVLSQVDAVAIARHNYTVVLDVGNGAQAVTAPLLCRRLNCNTVLLNETIDGRFPGRGSEPTPDNLSELSDAVVRNKADVGMAFDGDGDRSIICDERGTILTGDRSALVLVRYLLTDNPGSTVVTCLNSGHAIEGLAEEYGSPVVRTRVGSVEVSRRMVSSGALAGFEENGGFMYGRHNQVRDGVDDTGPGAVRAGVVRERNVRERLQPACVVHHQGQGTVHAVSGIQGDRGALPRPAPTRTRPTESRRPWAPPSGS